jgi:hypothetical protein
MESRCLLGIFLSVLVSVSTAFTTGRMVPMQTQPGATAPRGLKSGDRIRVHTHDGRHSDFDFEHVSADGDVFGRNHEQVRASDIAMVERRSVDKTRTSLLIIATVAGTLAVAIVVSIGTTDLLDPYH